MPPTLQSRREGGLDFLILQCPSLSLKRRRQVSSVHQARAKERQMIICLKRQLGQESCCGRGLREATLPVFQLPRLGISDPQEALVNG